MTTSRVHGRRRAARPDTRRSAERQTLTAAGRAGFAARGVVYVLIGALAVGIALGSGGASADRQGAPAQVPAQPFGKTMLWVLVVGFGCMALWRGARAVLGRGPRRKAASRVLDGGRALFYAASAGPAPRTQPGAARAPAATRSRRTGRHRHSNWPTAGCWWGPRAAF